MKRFEEIIATDEAKVFTLNSSIKSVSMVYGYFKNNLVSEIKPISIELGISFNTVSKAVNSLLEMNMLSIEHEQSRHRQYVYRDLLSVIYEPENILI